MTSLTHDRPVRPDARAGYVKVPSALLDLDLTPREYQLVTLILDYRWNDGEAFPFVVTMATRLRCSARTIQRTVVSLERKGVLVVEERYRASDKGQTSNVYSPGPVLAALLSAVDAEPDAPSSDGQHPPVTAPPLFKETDSGRRPQSGRPRDQSRPQPPSDPRAYTDGPYGRYVNR